VDFNASKVIDEIDVFSVQDVYNSPSEPTLAMTFSTYSLTTFQAQYWNGSAWVTVPNGNITGNNRVWKQIAFSPVTTNKIRIWITGSSDGYSRMTEVEAWGTSVPVTRQNVAASANGGTATASQTNSAPYSPSGAINGDRKLYLNNNAWANSTATFPQWLQVDFNGSKDIDEIDVFSVQDVYNSPNEPTLAMTFSAYGLTAFQAQYWNGSAWLTVPNGSITGNNNVWKQITFSPITTSKIRIWITGSSDGYSRMTEVEAWGVPTGSGGSSGSVQWLISDHLGTPRMVLDQTGSLANLKRHDYLPFGEELVAPTGGRNATQGYAGGDGVRQQFTAQERDFSYGTPFFIGITAGVMFENGREYPYIGLGLMLPGPGASVTYSPDTVSGGVNAELQLNLGLAASVGVDEQENSFTSQGGGWPPGISLTEYYVFRAKRPTPPEPQQPRRNKKTTPNCACNR
jgi:F5/8 type C domain-containing protein